MSQRHERDGRHRIQNRHDWSRIRDDRRDRGRFDARAAPREFMRSRDEGMHTYHPSDRDLYNHRDNYYAPRLRPPGHDRRFQDRFEPFRAGHGSPPSLMSSFKAHKPTLHDSIAMHGPARIEAFVRSSRPADMPRIVHEFPRSSSALDYVPPKQDARPTLISTNLKPAARLLLSDSDDDNVDDDNPDDDDDAEDIEDKLETVENDIAKHERLLATIRAKMASEAAAVAEAEAAAAEAAATMHGLAFASSTNGPNRSSHSLEHKPPLLPDLVLCDYRPRYLAHNPNEPESISALIEQIYKENHLLAREFQKRSFLRDKTLASNAAFASRSVSFTTEYDFYAKNIANHSKVRPFIVKCIQSQILARNHLEADLCETYEFLESDWKAHVAQLESKSTAQPGRFLAQTSQHVQVASEEQILSIAATTPTGGGRSSRRTVFRSDIARSEEEFQGILELLGAVPHEKEAMQLQRSIKDPPMLDPSQRARTRYIDKNDLVIDPVADLAAYNAKIDVCWSAQERDIFRLKLVQYGKAFPKIASFLPHKSVHDCIQFYYREKVNLRFKQILRQSMNVATGGRGGGGGGRRRKEKLLQMEISDHFFKTYVLAPDEDIIPIRPHMLRQHHADDIDIDDGPGPASTKQSSSKSKKRSQVLSQRDSTSTLPDRPGDAPGVQMAIGATDKTTISMGGDADVLAQWTEQEKESAMRAFDLVGRDFPSIAAMLKTKTPEQCRAFYNNIRRKGKEDAAAAAAAAGESSGGAGTRPLNAQPGSTKRKGKEGATTLKKPTKRKRTDTGGDTTDFAIVDGDSFEMDVQVDFLDPDVSIEDTGEGGEAVPKTQKRTKSRKDDALAGAGASTEDTEKRKRKIPRKRVSSLVTKDDQDPQQQQAPEDATIRKTVFYWSVNERNEFLNAVAAYGRNWDAIAKHLGTKSAVQARNYYQNMNQKLDLDGLLERHGHPLVDVQPIHRQSADRGVDSEEMRQRSENVGASGAAAVIGAQFPVSGGPAGSQFRPPTQAELDAFAVSNQAHGTGVPGTSNPATAAANPRYAMQALPGMYPYPVQPFPQSAAYHEGAVPPYGYPVEYTPVQYGMMTPSHPYFEYYRQQQQQQQQAYFRSPPPPPGTPTTQSMHHPQQAAHMHYPHMYIHDQSHAYPKHDQSQATGEAGDHRRGSVSSDKGGNSGTSTRAMPPFSSRGPLVVTIPSLRSLERATNAAASEMPAARDQSAADMPEPGSSSASAPPPHAPHAPQHSDAAPQSPVKQQSPLSGLPSLASYNQETIQMAQKEMMHVARQQSLLAQSPERQPPKILVSPDRRMSLHSVAASPLHHPGETSGVPQQHRRYSDAQAGVPGMAYAALPVHSLSQVGHQALYVPAQAPSVHTSVQYGSVASPVRSQHDPHSPTRQVSSPMRQQHHPHSTQQHGPANFDHGVDGAVESRRKEHDEVHAAEPDRLSDPSNRGTLDSSTSVVDPSLHHHHHHPPNESAPLSPSKQPPSTQP